MPPHGLTKGDNPEDVGLPRAAVEAAQDILGGCVGSSLQQVHGATLCIARCGVLHISNFGSSAPPNPNNPPPTTGASAGNLLRDSMPIVDDSIFLVASVTKPVTATAVVQLVERGLIALDTTACSIIPEFTGGGRELITIRHLLTHSSGLPDGIPENQAYRCRHAPLSDFTARMLQLGLLFTPGHALSYQSAGINILAEIVQRVGGLPFPDFLKRNIFEPLGMKDTTLGIRADRSKWREVACSIRPEAGQSTEQAARVLKNSNATQDAHCNWNSDYCARKTHLQPLLFCYHGLPQGVPWAVGAGCCRSAGGCG